MMFHHDAVGLAYSTAGNLINIVYKMEVEKHRNAYLFDLTRAKPKDYATEDLYSCMEQIKNGSVMNTKYETGVKMFEPVHIWVFANMMPNFDMCSLDRWKIWVLDRPDRATAELVPSKQNLVTASTAVLPDFD